jgi:hypothetical protein
MYESYATLMRAADAGYLNGNHHLAAPRAHRNTSSTGRSRSGLGYRRHGSKQAAAQSRSALRPACAGVDAAAR